MNYVAVIVAMVGAVLAVTPATHAQESPGIVTIEGTRIRGNQEIPTVMYLVPWQPPQVETLRAPDERLMVGQEFPPLERYEFQRFIRYHEAFTREVQPAPEGEM